MLELPYFVGTEIVNPHLELAVFGAEKGTKWVKDALGWYEGRDFVREDGSMEQEVQPRIMGDFMRSVYEWTPVTRKEEVTRDESKLFVFPCEWFNAHPYSEKGGSRYLITENTHTIHHYAGQWRDEEYAGGPLHKLYYRLFGIDWRLEDRFVRLHGTDEKNIR